MGNRNEQHSRGRRPRRPGSKALPFVIPNANTKNSSICTVGAIHESPGGRTYRTAQPNANTINITTRTVGADSISARDASWKCSKRHHRGRSAYGNKKAEPRKTGFGKAYLRGVPSGWKFCFSARWVGMRESIITAVSRSVTAEPTVPMTSSDFPRTKSIGTMETGSSTRPRRIHSLPQCS